jgi:hypothetical protein
MRFGPRIGILGSMFTPFADLTDGDLIRRIAALRPLRTGRAMGYPRYSGEITLMLTELMARGVELDEKGNPVIRAETIRVER